MSNPQWPSGLPQNVEVSGYQGKLPKGFIETEMEAGPPRRDRKSRGGEAETIGCVIWIADTDKATLDSFYNTTLKDGTLKFDWVHPIGQAAATMEFIDPPSHTLRSGKLLRYRFNLRVLP